MTNSTKEVFIHIVNARLAQSENVKALIILLVQHHLVICILVRHIHLLDVLVDRIIKMFLLLILVWMLLDIWVFLINEFIILDKLVALVHIMVHLIWLTSIGIHYIIQT